MDYSVDNENASNVVEQDNAPMDDASVADGEAPQEEVSITDYMPDVEQEPAEDTGDSDQLPNVSNQKDFNKALRERLSKESDKGYQRGRTEIENSPEMQYVRSLLEDRAREKGITTQQALEELQNERIQKQADYYAQNPSAWFAQQMRQQQPTQPDFPLTLSYSRWQTLSVTIRFRKVSMYGIPLRSSCRMHTISAFLPLCGCTRSVTQKQFSNRRTHSR